MVQMVGKYAHEKNENLDEYFKAIGVPYIARKMMAMSSPLLEIKIADDGKYTIVSTTMLRTHEVSFKLGEEYEEAMPGTVLKSTTVLEDDKLVTTSIALEDSKVIRTYEFSDTHCILTMKHVGSGIEAKRYFKRQVA